MKLLPEQIIASDPVKNIWLSANAGTGKTYVLVNRFLRLLLEGTEPGRILCITYTKAAAAEMQTRIIEGISKLILLSDAELKAKAENDYQKKFDIEKLTKTKKEIAGLIDHPEQLKIQTIHSFCQSVLKSFPLETGIPPFFNVIDDNRRAELTDESWNRLISGNTDGFAELSSRFPIGEIKKLFIDLFGETETLNEIITNAGGLENYIIFLKKTLGVESEDVIGFEQQVLAQFSEIVNQITQAQIDARDKYVCAALEKYGDDRSLENLHSIFFTEKGDFRSYYNKDFAEKFPTISLAAREASQNIEQALDKKKSIEMFIITKAVLKLFDEFSQIFGNAKRQRYLLDYDDLISKTSQLLSRSNPYSQWVLYKLDGGIDHILLDEAQDTNTKQWKVIRSIRDEFYSQKQKGRSYFVVGDEKQSIYSFQGADIGIFFEEKANFLSMKAQGRAEDFEVVDLDTSFRSCKAVLDVVDKVTANEKVRPAITNMDKIHEHKLDRDDHFGYFEINELVNIPKPEKTKEEKELAKQPIKWQLPREYSEEEDQKNVEVLAQKVAERVNEILNRKFPLANGEAPKPSDIMILVRNRNPLSKPIIKQLQKLNIPVSGADKLEIARNLIVKDLLALGKFLILENDDLNFACLLRSPIFEASEDELFDLCHDRGNKSVFRNLKEKANGNKRYKAMLDILEDLKAKASDSVFDIYFYALEVVGFRTKFIAYSGKQINEIIDEFLNVIRKYEVNNNSSLQHFTGWFENSDIKIKRNMKISEDEVRILTVHSAKGLEAPIVILPDTVVGSPEENKVKYVFHGDIFLCPVQADYRNALFDEIKKNDKDAADDEYYRLLYVALTRARDELYVFGHKGHQNKKDNWHNIIMDSVNGICEKDGERYVHTSKEYIVGIAKKVEKVEKKQVLEFKDVKRVETEAITPSRLYRSEDDKKIQNVNVDFDKGIAVHKLLEILPEIKKEERERIADVILKGFTELDEKQKNEIKRESFAVLENKSLSFIFEGKSRAEVPVCGMINNKFISGKIDRLVEKADEIVIIDYKTNRVSGGSIEAVKAGYKAQLDAYRQIMQKIYEDKRIRTALLFTAINELIYFD